MKRIKKEWTLRELAAESGVPERTIRFYISRGLVDPPLRGGRGAAYGPQHKARLEDIKNLQAKGMMLAEISNASAPAPSLPAPAVWRSYPVAPDVTVMVRAEAGPWRTKRILSALRQFSALIAGGSAEPEPLVKCDTRALQHDQEESKRDLKSDKDDKEYQGE